MATGLRRRAGAVQNHDMRIILTLLFLALAGPAFADDWVTYDNDRYGYAVDVPPGLDPQGESDSGDGQVFEAANGTQALLVWGGYLVDTDLIDELAARKTSYQDDGWVFTYEAKAPTWVSLSGKRGGQVIYVRAVSSCGGRLYAMFEFHYAKADIVKLDPVVTRLVHSLKQKRC